MTRLDILLVNKGYVKSREKAKCLIKDGKVSIDGNTAIKASQMVSDDAQISVDTSEVQFVSRGAYKLKHAIEVFDIDINGKTCLDIGASTGGFTQVMLLSGAELVYAVDVGHDQLDDELKSDTRIISMEGKNYRYMDASELGDKVDFITADLSFISLTLILENAYNMLKDGGEMVALIKPQFEAGRQNINKHGIVKSKKVQNDVIQKIVERCSETGFSVAGTTGSPIKGGDGNEEFLIYLKKL